MDKVEGKSTAPAVWMQQIVSQQVIRPECAISKPFVCLAGYYVSIWFRYLYIARKMLRLITLLLFVLLSALTAPAQKITMTFFAFAGKWGARGA